MHRETIGKKEKEKMMEGSGGIGNKTRPGAARRYTPADGSLTRGGFTFVRGRVRSPHVAKLQTATYNLGQLRA